MYHNLRIFFLLLFTCFLTYAQNDIEVLEPTYIKSVQLRAKKINAFVPIVRLGQQFVFSFDDLEGDEKEYTYKLTHCTANWEVTDILSTEFIDGFKDDTIRDYENSFNTFQDYTHYQVQIPNQSTRIKISGNYILSVLDDSEEVVFTRRFIVYEKKVDVGVSIHKARKIDDIKTKQNVELFINHPNLKINNPSQEIKIAIYKNNDWNNVITDIKPQYFRGTQLLYKYGEETTFFGGNEFLYFDTKDYRTGTNTIRHVELKDIYETRLYLNISRGAQIYTHYPDINGNFFLRTVNAESTKTEGDYTNVHFIYKSNSIEENEEVYVYGAFNDWQFTEENKLTLSGDNYYETAILLKQGFYNYTYVTLDTDGNINQTLEGTHFQTENDYTTIVYYSQFGAKYDQVIGYGVGNSVNLQN